MSDRDPTIDAATDDWPANPEPVADDRARVIGGRLADHQLTWGGGCTCRTWKPDPDLAAPAAVQHRIHQTTEIIAALSDPAAPEAVPEPFTCGFCGRNGGAHCTDCPKYAPVPVDATLTADQLVALLTAEQRYAVKAARSMTLLTLLMVVGKIKADTLAQRAAADPKTGWPSTGSNPSDAAHPAPGGPPPDDPRIEAVRADAFEAGARQAIEWLRAGYEYGTGPEWRENGAEWIADRLAEHRRAALGDQP